MDPLPDPSKRTSYRTNYLTSAGTSRCSRIQNCSERWNAMVLPSPGSKFSTHQALRLGKAAGALASAGPPITAVETQGKVGWLMPSLGVREVGILQQLSDLSFPQSQPALRASGAHSTSFHNTVLRSLHKQDGGRARKNRLHSAALLLCDRHELGQPGRLRWPGHCGLHAGRLFYMFLRTFRLPACHRP